MTRKPIVSEKTSVISTPDKPAGVIVHKKFASAPKSVEPRRLWILLALLLLAGLLVLGVAGWTVWHWVYGLPLFNGAPATAPSTTNLPIERSVAYDELTIAILSAQDAATFQDDAIHAGPATVRLNLRVSNTTTGTISIIYYDVARLLLPQHSSTAPSNLTLPTDYKPGTNATGWIDFPIPTGMQLTKMTLQLGSSALNETLVTLPFSGAFNPARYTSRHVPQSLVIYYYFEGHTLTYHLNSVDISYAYHGSEVKAGDQYYILNFTVDNPNGVVVSPGLGFDYVRLVIDGTNSPPIDNTLPYSFPAGARSVGGHVAYIEQAGMQSLTLAFLRQLVAGQDNYSFTT